ncbi:MAG: single-stranded-DNA-specific exonuclease RecJ, partial [Oscillospiraceae bacterium]|nr:single-stranded-DNA-specific exonuclease RecJ [Candidatus Equicaccousia limihippi]
YKKWQLKSVDKAMAMSLAEECGGDPLVSLIACARGINDPQLLDEFLSDEGYLSSFADRPEVIAAKERILCAIKKGEKICIYGDYDCDGVTATALLCKFLKNMGADVTTYLPSRFAEGYGLNADAVKKLKENGVSLIVTVDNGISANEEIALAQKSGIDVIVTDHHRPQEVLPECVAVIDPFLMDDIYFKEYSGVGVAFLVACAIGDLEPEELLYEYCDLVALGTVADLMPLKGDNRVFVKTGLYKLNREPSPSFEALIYASGFEGKEIVCSNLSFGLAPRINAAGRMATADIALNLMLCDDAEKCREMASTLCAYNTERQEKCKEIFENAKDRILADRPDRDRVIVVCGNGWFQGVIGIVASQIVQKFGAPAIVFCDDGSGTLKGSGRSIEGFSLFDAISAVSGDTEKFGGHALAAGVTIKKENLEKFRQNINGYAENFARVQKTLSIDCKLNPAAIDCDLVRALDALEPCGSGNATPIFAVYDGEISSITELSGGKHLSLMISKNGAGVKVLCFNLTRDKFPFNVGQHINIAFTLSINLYMGRESVSAVMKDIRPADYNEEQEEQKDLLFDRYLKGEYAGLNKSGLCPTREKIGSVYRAVTSSPRREELTEISGIDWRCAEIALDILCEIGVVQKTDYNNYTVVEGAKSDLAASKILNSIERG